MMRHHPSFRVLGTILVAAAALSLQSRSVLAQDGAAIEDRSAAEGASIKHLPADRDGLTFRGENTTREWAVYLTRAEANKVGEFRLALMNAISVLPERSTLTFSINGHTLATPAVRSPGKATNIIVRIPPGILVPGFNAVEVSIDLAHRVDCSVKATYELWAILDPSQTGFLIPSAAAFSARSVADIAGESISKEGTTRIHVRLKPDADASALERTSRLIGTIVREAQIARPLVDVGQEPGKGPGFDVVMPSAADGDPALSSARILVRRPDFTVARDARTNRLLIVVSGEPGDQKASPREELLGSEQGLSALGRRAGTAVSQAGAMSFADLGLPTQVFSGRHFLHALRVSLPNDFYPGSYDKVRLSFDGSHTGNLTDGSSIVFRVNGALVSSLRLQNGVAEQFNHEMVELPLRFFRPGYNEIQLEGFTATPSDRVCDLVNTGNEPRLIVEGTSEIEFPHLAHLATVPRIGRALPSAAEQAKTPHDFYLPDGDESTIGVGLTVAANLAAQGAPAPVLRYHLKLPGPSDQPGIVLGTVDDLPAALARAINEAASPSDAAPGPKGGTPAVQDATMRRTSPTWAARAEDWFRERGFFFAATPDLKRRLTIDDRSLIVASVAPESSETKIAGIELPRFREDTRNWLVLTAKSAGTYAAGIDRLVADGLWPQLTGQAVALDVEDGRFETIDPKRLTYILPQNLALADVRPIVGGLVSSNLVLSAAALIFFLSLFGLFTHALVRSGRKHER